MISAYDAAIYYITKMGWYLVPIPSGKKGLDAKGWNEVENSIHTVEGAIYWKNNPLANMGLLHAPSGTMSFDIDDIEKTKILLDSFGIDYEELLSGAPRIKGSPGHDKAIFKMPEDVVLTAKKLSWEGKDDPNTRDTIFELRGGFVQDVLPPSIHPDTHNMYEWKKPTPPDIPIIPEQLLTIWKEWDKFRPQLINACPWATKVARPPSKKRTTVVDDEDDIIGQFNRATPIDTLIEKYGYKKTTGGKYLSPYSKKGIAGVVVFKEDNKLYSHHASEPFDTSYSHDAFDIYCHFEHSENIIEGIKGAAKILGVKTKYEKEIEDGKSISDDLIKSSKAKKEMVVVADIKQKKTTVVENYEARQEEDNKKMEIAVAEAALVSRLPDFPGTLHPLFGEWMKIGSEISYARPTFHYFTLLTILSMAPGRSVRTKVGLNNIYPNIFCMLLGTSSISGKSYAIEMARKFLDRIISAPYGLNQSNKILISIDKVTEPRLVQDLSKNNNMYWEYDECQAFFKDVEKYNGSILPQLCKIYDGTSVSSRLSRASAKKDDAVFEWICGNPFLSCLFAMTTDQFDRLANSDYLEGGFLPRVMFPLEEGGTVSENVDVSEAQEEAIKVLLDEVSFVAEKLRMMDENSISFYVSKKIESWKVEKTNEFCGPENVNKRIAVQRSFIHAYKIAMVLSLYDKEFQTEILWAEYPMRAHIPEKWIDEALLITEKYLFPRTVYVLDRAAEENVKSNMSLVKRALMKNNGSMDKAKLIRTVRILKDDLDKVITTMIESNEIEPHYHTSPGANKVTTTYCLKKL